ncbi:beta-propeller domain-containing protein [Zhongshania guokunii]|uniref:Beta-propeller domain-containing protein n=1 Tax=Zhongshania guokunii TaxID=641783 RepID=A0ABV3U681_9GAMM
MYQSLSSTISLSIILLGLAACGGGSSGSPLAANGSIEKGLLRAVKNDAEFIDQFRAAYTRPVDSNNNLQAVAANEANAPSADNGGDSTSYSTTYTLENNVDELDVLKYDGDHLYIAPTLQSRCCFVSQGGAFADSASFAPPSPEQSSGIRILSTNSETATTAELSTIPLEAGEFVQGLYISETQLISIGSSQYYGPYGVQWLGIFGWQQQNLTINIYNTSTITQPELTWKIGIEGGLVDSRRIGDTLYIISRHSPYFDNIYTYPANRNEANANAQQLAAIQPQDIIPTLTINGESRPLFSPQNCLLSRDDPKRDYAYPVITSVTAINLSSPNTAQSVCFNEDSSGVYVSQKALYLSQARYTSQAGNTRIHKFKLNAGSPEYSGSADIAGQLWGPGQTDFRMSEYDDLLRVVTTIYTSDSTDLRDHQLSILRENTDTKSLDLVGSLPNTQRPQEIGKANEALYGVRFFEDRAYFVTFEQIDPLYVIDLSAPADPYIAGELEIPGFSDFLHPINSNLLLGLGQSAQNQGMVKLSLFNVSDINNPSELGSLLLGKEGGWNYSEAQYNRHAFTYLQQADGSDRLTVPVQSAYNTEQDGYVSENRLYLMEINGKTNAAAASLDLIGNIIASPAPSNNWYGGQNRSVIHNDAVFFLSGDYIWSALWSDSSQQTGPQ